MSRVKLMISYEIEPSKREEYLTLIRELKILLNFDSLEDYSVYEVKGKPNHFEEIYTYKSVEAFENSDDEENERINILINKLSTLTNGHSTKYSTLFEVNSNKVE
ncbi:MAG: hypothetical protein CO128_08985 [Ignavibacteriales bacterium CG_4_9_14_3_um_filter_30_11]|nr:MAG: hypothetical protein CO128_08985 [Ignavibacteriales bacterium CG_4_9_14_3_um_filter_30_11]